MQVPHQVPVRAGALRRRRARAPFLRPGPRGRLPLPAADPGRLRREHPRHDHHRQARPLARAGYPGDALAPGADDADTPFMGGSTADTPSTPEFLPASDAERDHAVSELRNEFSEGRLSHETFMHRMQTALDARNRGQLAGLFTDLPPRPPGPRKL